MLTVNAMQVQKHQIRGPVGYTKVGSPTIVDGIASGFSSSDYLTLNESPSYTTSDSCEWNIKFTVTDTSITAWMFAFMGPSGIMCGCYRTNNRVYTYFTNNLTRDISYQFSNNTTYIYNMTKQSNGDYTISLKSASGSVLASVSGSGWSENITYLSRKIGIAFTTGNPDLIDLNETYIKVNGKLWFYQPAPTKYVVKDDKLVFADSGLYLTGTNNYTVVGTPTITDGIASGFSASNGLRINNGFNLQTPYEMVVSFSVNNISGGGNLCTFQATNNITYGLYLGNNGQLNFYSPVGAFLNSSAGAISTNQNYKAKYVMDGTNQSLYLDSGSGYVLQKTSTVTSNNHSINYFEFGIGTSFLYGSIYLNETYVKVNDQLWFYGKNYASKNIAPVPAGYTYGNTTTSAIGWVDMRTQGFTAAPAGATIGRDE